MQSYEIFMLTVFPNLHYFLPHITAQLSIRRLLERKRDESKVHMLCIILAQHEKPES